MTRAPSTGASTQNQDGCRRTDTFVALVGCKSTQFGPRGILFPRLWGNAPLEIQTIQSGSKGILIFTHDVRRCVFLLEMYWRFQDALGETQRVTQS